MKMRRRCSPARRPFRLIGPLSNAIPTFYLSLAILYILSAEQQIKADSVDADEWFDRRLRVPKPKFIRFGRAQQKLIQYGRGFEEEPHYEEGTQLDELVDAVDKLYQFAPKLRAPKRAQKFIRFG